MDDGRDTDSFLLRWLSLLGWRISFTGLDPIEATAEHVTDDGSVLRVRATGNGEADVTWLLFQRALAALETVRRARIAAADAARVPTASG